MTGIWTSDKAEFATKGESSDNWIANGVSIDTRTLEKGDLFVALRGPNFDGHDFVQDAFLKGAVAAVVERDTEGIFLKVRDTSLALDALGRAARERTRATIIAVTGSVGKTGCKEALKFTLSHQASTSASICNLNNHFGVPLSLSRMPEETVYGVFEIGMNHPGEISPLSCLVRPHVALITTVELAHSKFFENEDAIADAKAEIFDGLEENGTVILNRDNKYFHHLSQTARKTGVKKIVSFGIFKEADFKLLEVEPDEAGRVIKANLSGKIHSYRLGLPGSHWALNSLGVLATISASGGDVIAAANLFEEMQVPSGRGNHHVLQVKGGSVTLIDDSYNASPVSMKAAIEVLSETKPSNAGRRIAVLGDMLELGKKSIKLHVGLVDVLEEKGIDLVFTFGDKMEFLAKSLPPSMRAGHAKAINQLEKMIIEAIQPGDVLVVKGSSGNRMGNIIKALIEMDQNRFVEGLR